MIKRRHVLAGLIAAPASIHPVCAFFNPPMFMPASGGGAFNPTSLITGAGGFWRADMGVTGSPSVTQWNDQSSFGNNLTTSSSPTFSATGFNASFPGIKPADGSTQSMKVTAAFPVTTTASIFMLIQPNAPSTAFNRLVWVLTGAADDFHSGAFNTENTSSPPGFESDANGAIVGTAFNFADNSLQLIGITFDGAHAQAWQGGATSGASTAFTANLGAASSTSFGFGGDASSGGQAASAAQYAFFGITQRAMNSTDWTNLKNWSNSNWGTAF